MGRGLKNTAMVMIETKTGYAKSNRCIMIFLFILHRSTPWFNNGECKKKKFKIILRIETERKRNVDARVEQFYMYSIVVHGNSNKITTLKCDLDR